MKVKIEGQRKFRRQIKQFAKAIGVDVKTALIQKAVQTGNQLAIQTEPYSTGKEAKKTSVGVIGGDFQKAFFNEFHILKNIMLVNKRLGGAYHQAIEANDWVAAEKIMHRALGSNIKTGDADNIDRQRNRRGRVKGSHDPVFVKNYKGAKAYKAKLMKAAGTAKAGWYSATMDLRSEKTRKPPLWLRKGSELGTGSVSGSEFKTIVTLTNHVRYTPNNLKRSKIKKAMSRDLKGFKKRMEKTIEKANLKR